MLVGRRPGRGGRGLEHSAGVDASESEGHEQCGRRGGRSPSLRGAHQVAARRARREVDPARRELCVDEGTRLEASVVSTLSAAEDVQDGVGQLGRVQWQPQVMLLALGSENARRALIVEGPHLGLEGGLALAHGRARAFGVQSEFKLTQLQLHRGLHIFRVDARAAEHREASLIKALGWPAPLGLRAHQAHERPLGKRPARPRATFLASDGVLTILVGPLDPQRDQQPAMPL